MAQGRMLNRKIGLNKAVNYQLSSDTSRLAFTWTIPFLDRDGRVHGEPSVLKALVFPRRKDITDEKMEEFIEEWVDAGLVIWYEAEGDLWLYFPKFHDNQPKLRYDREASSAIPGPNKGRRITRRSKSGVTPEQVRSDSAETAAETAEEVPQNLKEFNITEFNISESNGSEVEASPASSPSAPTPEINSPPPNPPPKETGRKSKTDQLKMMAEKLRVEDPAEYKKFIRKHPALSETEASTVPP